MSFLLQHTNRHNERFFFVALGEPWPHRPEFRMIKETTPDPKKARVFDTAPEALAILLAAGEPDKAGHQWEVVAA